jgi:hypothetical protein
MPESFTQSLVKLLQPMFYDDVNQSNALNIYLSGLGLNFEIIEKYARDSDDGKIGYSILVDATRVPDEAITWLGQFVGIQITQGLTPTQQKQQLVGLGNWKRGTVAALKAAPLPLLTGSQTVIVKERDTSPYHFQVMTLAAETPDSTKVLAALLTQKPAGLVMNYIVFSGQKAFAMRSSALRGTPPDTLRLAI